MGGLRANLIGAIVTATAALGLTLFLLEGTLMEYRQSVGTRAELEEAIADVHRAITGGTTPQDAANQVSARRASRIRVFDRDGRLLADSALTAAQVAMQPSLSEEEFRSFHEPSTLLATPRQIGDIEFLVVRGRLGNFAIEAARPMSVIEGAVSSLREVLIVGGVFMVLIAGVLTIVLSRTMVAPIRDLTRAADALAKGDLSVRVRSDRSDELGELGRALDAMADELSQRVHNLRSEEARLRTVLDAMVEAVLVTDHLGRIAMTNRALDQLARGPARGRSVIEVIRSLELESAVKAARRGTASTAEFDIDIDGEKKSFAAVAAPFQEEAGVVAVLHDVTRLKMAERVRRDFVANASHELRTPLTAIRGYAETLQDGAIADQEAAKRFLATIVRHAIRLQHIVNDLAVLSRAESPEQRYQVEIVDVHAVAADVVHGLESQARKHEIRLSLAEPTGERYARADERALDQVLVNLVDNAIKYTPKGGQVTVGTRSDKDYVMVEVSDTGPGIAPQHRDRIFERFYRVDPGRSRELGGTGLGLAIVKHLVAGMGGKIDLSSDVGVGTTFRVRLRIASPNEREIED